MYQQDLEAIDGKKLCLRAKFNAKIEMCKRWNDELVRAGDGINQKIGKMREMIDKSKKKLHKNGEELQKLREDLEHLRAELNNDDSGIGEMLTSTEQMDDNQYDFDNRQKALAESIDESSQELEQLSLELSNLCQSKSDNNDEFVELQQKLEQLSAELQQAMISM